MIFILLIFVGCFALSIIQTWLFNITRGSLFICIILHDLVNTSAPVFFGKTLNRDFTPFILFTGLLILFAIIVTIKTDGRLSNEVKITVPAAVKKATSKV